MQQTTINLFGASGHAKVIMDIVKAQGDEVGCLYDDNPHCSDIHGIPVYKARDVAVQGPMIISIGSCHIRKMISNRFNVRYAKAMHPSAIISESVEIGDGSVVMPKAAINADSKIGRHCIVNTGASIDHECRIEDYVHIAPGCTLSGEVVVGEGSWVGVGTCIKQGIHIGKNCMIGAGSVVVEDIPDNVVAYGNPCRIREKNN